MTSAGRPSVSIVFEIGRAPDIVWNTLNDREARRLQAWILENPQIQDAIARALCANPTRLFELLDDALGE